MKRISILGSTGSIGRQALEVVDFQKDIKIVAISGNSNVSLLSEQIRKYKPETVCIASKDKYSELKSMVSDVDIEIFAGEEYLSEISAHKNSDAVLTSVVGNVGLIPTVDAIKEKKNILLANKETLVTSGEFVMPLAEKYGVMILPVDSEHSAIFQCLKSGKQSEVSKILLTCSGGPFFGKTKEEISNKTPQDALKHPNWDMGAKITIDSATLMNKGLEVIEAKWLFGVDVENIEVYIHRQSVVHSMVEFSDGSVIAQMGIPDMKLPIQYAINYPDRLLRIENRLDLIKTGSLTFTKPDTGTFECLSIAFDAVKAGGTIPAIMNASNEIAVEAFLKHKISFLDIATVIKETMKEFTRCDASLETVLKADADARIKAREIIERI